MSRAVTVRPYEPEDYHAVCALWREAGWKVPTAPAFDAEQSRGGAVFVAESDSETPGMSVGGVAVWTAARRCAVVRRVAVTEALRRRGVATALLREVERSAREHGFRRLALDCRQDNVAAAALYVREGWIPDRARNWIRRRLRPVLVRLGLRRTAAEFVETWSKRLPPGKSG